MSTSNARQIAGTVRTVTAAEMC